MLAYVIFAHGSNILKDERSHTLSLVEFEARKREPCSFCHEFTEA